MLFITKKIKMIIHKKKKRKTCLTAENEHNLKKPLVF